MIDVALREGVEPTIGDVDRLLHQNQNSRRFTCEKLNNFVLVSPQYVHDLVARAIPESEPDELWWRADEYAAVIKVRVFRDDGEFVFPCVVPNFAVRMPFQTN